MIYREREKGENEGGGFGETWGNFQKGRVRKGGREVGRKEGSEKTWDTRDVEVEKELECSQLYLECIDSREGVFKS